MFENLEDLTAASVEIEGEEFPTTYSFEKMKAMQAWKVLLTIRAEVGKTLKEEIGAAFGNQGQATGAIITTILTLPTEFIETLQNTLWQHTYYANKHTGNKRQLIYQTDDAAFDGQDPVVIGEVLARALAVNFTSSFQRITSWISTPPNPNTPPSSPSE